MIGNITLIIFASPVYRFIPTFFEKDISTGIPTLTAEGWKAVEEELKRSDGEP